MLHARVYVCPLLPNYGQCLSSLRDKLPDDCSTFMLAHIPKIDNARSRTGRETFCYIQNPESRILFWILDRYIKDEPPTMLTHTSSIASIRTDSFLVHRACAASMQRSSLPMRRPTLAPVCSRR